MENIIKIELGGGYAPQEGYVNIDKIPGSGGIEIILDFEKENIPYQDNSVDEITTKHCLEHIQDIKHVLNECHRILKPEGIMKIIVPHKDNPKAYVLDHKRFFTEESFKTLDRPEFEKYYGIKPWKILECRTNSSQDIYTKMQPNK